MVSIFMFIIIYGAMNVFMSEAYPLFNDSMNHSSQFAQEAGQPTMDRLMDVWYYVAIVACFGLMLYGFARAIILEGSLR